MNITKFKADIAKLRSDAQTRELQNYEKMWLWDAMRFHRDFGEFKTLACEHGWDVGVTYLEHYQTYALEFTTPRKSFVMGVTGLTTDVVPQDFLDTFTTLEEARAKNDRMLIKPVKEAFRNSVVPQLLEFRRDNNVGSDMHIDHLIPFKNLFDSFIALSGLGLENIKINKIAGQRAEIDDQDIKNAWFDYHLKNSILREIPSKDNLTRKDEKDYIAYIVGKDKK